jgi:hypothetical protein
MLDLRLTRPVLKLITVLECISERARFHKLLPFRQGTNFFEDIDKEINLSVADPWSHKYVAQH